MPNWCGNRITITGAKCVIQSFLDQAKAKDSYGKKCPFTFNAFVPMPKEVFRGSIGSEEQEKYPGELNWYDWSVNHWGTKWDVNDESVHIEWENTKDSDIVACQVKISFDTAWSPPEPVVRAMAKAFPALHFVHEFVEHGESYAGRHEYSNGVAVNVEDWTDEERVEEMGRNLDHDYI